MCSQPTLSQLPTCLQWLHKNHHKVLLLGRKVFRDWLKCCLKIIIKLLGFKSGQRRQKFLFKGWCSAKRSSCNSLAKAMTKSDPSSSDISYLERCCASSLGSIIEQTSASDSANYDLFQCSPKRLSRLHWLLTKNISTNWFEAIPTFYTGIQKRFWLLSLWLLSSA